MARKGRTQAGKLVTVTGSQVYVDVVNGTSGTKLFNTVNVLAVSPDSFGTEIADLANHYNQYRFTHLKFVYQPSAYNLRALTTDSHGSGVNNLFAFGFEPDGVPTFTVTYGSIAGLRSNIIVPVTGYDARQRNVLNAHCDSKKWYYTKDDLTDNGTIRQTIFGLLYGEAKTSITTSLTWGDIKIEYTIQFKDMCPTQGVTMVGLMREAALGKTHMLDKTLLMIKHAAAFGASRGVVTDDMLQNYTNEECIILGINRPFKAVAYPTDNRFVRAVDKLLVDMDEFESDSVFQEVDPAIVARVVASMRKL
jgi:hypothetical protein